jgi:hypothetical protein
VHCAGFTGLLTKSDDIWLILFSNFAKNVFLFQNKLNFVLRFTNWVDKKKCMGIEVPLGIQIRVASSNVVGIICPAWLE